MVAQTKNLNWQYENAQAISSDMKYYQIKLHSFIIDLTSDLVVYRESVNEININWSTTSIIKYHLENMYKH